MKQTTWGLVMATGKSEQISSEIETAFLYLNDRPVLAYSLSAFMRCADIEGIVVVVSRERAESVLGMVQMFGYSKVRKIVVGSARRSASMAAGLEHVDDEVEFVCVHDASRPLVTPALISETVRCAWKHGSGVAAAEIADAVVSAKKGAVDERQDVDGRLWTVGSPQAYPRGAGEGVSESREEPQELRRRLGGGAGAGDRAAAGADGGDFAAHPLGGGFGAGAGADEVGARRKPAAENTAGKPPKRYCIRARFGA